MTYLIPFNEWSKERIAKGKKHCTSRHTKYRNDPRVLVILPKLPWSIIREYFWRDEGAESPKELQRVIENIYKRAVPDNELFFVHYMDFKRGEKK
jgi:hypothetical protein